jgi:hypothetical protein
MAPGREREREIGIQVGAGPHYSIQRRRNGRWLVLAEDVDPYGVSIGRFERRGDVQSAIDLLAKIVPNGAGLRVVDLGGGIFRRIREPTEIDNGDRLRIGRHTLVYCAGRLPGETSSAGGPPPCLELLVSEGGPGPRIPLLGPVTIVGRKDDQADIALVEDELISARHLCLRVAGGRMLAEDLQSRNGSYVQLADGSTIQPGEVFLVGHYRLRASLTHVSTL